jgi:hypothetical protein
MGFGSRKNTMDGKRNPYHFPRMCKFIMKHLLSNPPSNHLMDNMLKTNVEEWRKSESNFDEYVDSYIDNIYNKGTEDQEK